jgi:signal transduction histidine kinase
MLKPLTSVSLRTERDVVQARQAGRDVAAALGFDRQDQIRVATATSEMARNAFRYAKNGKVEFLVEMEAPQRLVIRIADSGPGIPHLNDVLDGMYQSTTGLGKGIVGTKRLMDAFDIRTAASGTTVVMSKEVPVTTPVVSELSLARLQKQVQKQVPANPYAEIEAQNQELLKTLAELRGRQEELVLLNRELEDTNRGVVALYAELEERADFLRRVSDLKTTFLSNMSHEFRTPLNSIMSLSRMLLEEDEAASLSAEQRKQVRFIAKSAQDLAEMVNDLLDIAKVEAGKVVVRPKVFAVYDLFGALRGVLKPLLADNSSLDLSSKLRSRVFLSSIRMRVSSHRSCAT